MQETDLFLIFTERLNALEIRYMVTGSVASIIYGEPRLTHDLDVVLHLPPEVIERFLNSFPEDKFYHPPTEVVQIEIDRTQRGHINIIEFSSGFKLDVYFPGRDPLIAWGLERAQEVPYKDTTLKVAPSEYVILQKLRFYREGRSEKHLRDISSILAVSGDQLNYSEIDNWVGKLGLENEWNSAKTSVTE